MRPPKRTGILLGALLLALAPLAAAQDGTATTTTMTTPSSAGDGRLALVDGRASGRHVSFGVDAGTGTVCGWTFEGTLMIDRIAWTGFAGELRTEGAVAVLSDTGEAGASTGSPTTAGTATADNATGNATGTTAPPAGNGTGNATQTTTGNATATTAPPTTSPPTGSCPAGNATAGAGQDDGGDDGQGDADDRRGGGRGRPDGAGGGRGSRVVLHDNPIGSVKLEARGGDTLRIDLADGLNATLEDGGRRVRVDGDGVGLLLWQDNDDKGADFSVDGSTIAFDGDKGNLMLRVVEGGEEGDEQVATAASEGRVAAEVNVQQGGDVVAEPGDDQACTVTTVRASTHIEIRIEVDVDLLAEVRGSATTTTTAAGNATGNATGTTTPPAGNGTGNATQTTTGGNATATNTTAPATTASTGTATGGAGGGGPVTVIVVLVDVDVLAGNSADQLTVMLDGRPVQVAASLGDVLAFEDDDEPKALLQASAEGEARLVASVREGPQSLRLEAPRPLSAAAEPAYGDDSDDGVSLDVSEDDGGDDGGDGGTGGAAGGGDGGVQPAEDEGGEVGVSVPAPSALLLACALLAAAAWAVRRRL